MQHIVAIGDSLPIRDANMKATGRFKYVGDIKKPNMLHARLIPSKYWMDDITILKRS